MGSFHFSRVKVNLLISLRDLLTGFRWQRQKLRFGLVGTNNLYQNEMPTKIQRAGPGFRIQILGCSWIRLKQMRKNTVADGTTYIDVSVQ